MHRILERQLNKHIDLKGPFPPGWEAFLKAIDEMYVHSDEDRHLIEHALEIASKELTEKNDNLQNSLQSAKQLEEKLIQEKANIEKKVEERTQFINDQASRLHAAVNSLNIGLIMTDMNNKVLTFNTAAKNILLSNPNIQTHHLSDEVIFSSSESVDISSIQHFFGNDFDLNVLTTQCMQQKRSIDLGEISYARRILRISFRPILAINRDQKQDREILGVIIIIQDITEQKNIERSKDEFFSIASHELRTPLTAIRGNTALIQQYYLEKLQQPELKEMISDIHESSIRLISIVNDFLDTSRLEMGRMQFKKEPFDLQPVINEVIKEYITTSSINMLTLKLADPGVPIPQVIGDRARIKQVLINLIGNSLKFTQSGGITVSLELKDQTVITKVSDTGKGIQAGNQSLLFRKFQQAGSSLYTRDDVQGTGLGLYISDMMMNGMGGKIWLDSSVVDKGTTFAFSLPIVT